MAKSVNQKGKILYLEKILRETNESHTCSMQEILSRLMEHGIAAERKSIYDDMEVLRNFGMDIRFKRGKAAGYYVAGEISEKSEKLEESEKLEGSEELEESRYDLENNQKKFSWLLPISESDEDEKPLKLICANGRKNEIMNAFGEKAQYREKDSRTFITVMQVKETPEFYGWLAGMGRDVVIAKPKRSVQAYREYLKGILKEYK